MLDKISSKVLFERTFSKDDERKSVAEIWEAFLKFPELPMLEGAIRQYAKGFTITCLGFSMEIKYTLVLSISDDQMTEECEFEEGII